MTNPKTQRKEVVTDPEIDLGRLRAEGLKHKIFRLRGRALLALLETGKRREEIISLERSDLSQEKGYLNVRFTVRKKRKKNLLLLQRVKQFKLEGRLSRDILAYLEFIEEACPGSKWLFPAGRLLFNETYIFYPDRHLEGQTLLQFLKKLTPEAWAHLYRERRAVKIIRAHEEKYGSATLETVFAIKRALDLEKEETAYNYIRRHERQKVEEEGSASID